MIWIVVNDVRVFCDSVDAAVELARLIMRPPVRHSIAEYDIYRAAGEIVASSHNLGHVVLMAFCSLNGFQEGANVNG